MSEKRRPDASMVMTIAGKRRRYEIYKGEQFADRMTQAPFIHADMPSMTIYPVDLVGNDFVRVRCNGVWLPSGQRALYPLSRVAALIAMDLKDQLRRGIEE